MAPASGRRRVRRKRAKGAPNETARVPLEFAFVEVRKRAPRVLEVAHEVPDDPVGFSEGHAALHEVLGKVGRAREALVGGL